MGELLSNPLSKSVRTIFELPAKRLSGIESLVIGIPEAVKPVGDLGKVMAQLFVQVSQHPNFDIEALHESIESMSALVQVLHDCSESPMYHVHILVSPYSTSAEQQEAVEWLRDRWIWRGRRISAGQLGSIVLAISESKKPQEIRLGRKWVTDRDQRKSPQIPFDFSSTEYLQWVEQRCWHWYREIYDNSTKTATDQVDLQIFCDSSVPNPLDSLIAVEESRDARYKVAQLIGVTTSKEQEFLHTLLQILKDSPDLEPKQALTKTRRTLGKSPTSSYQLLYRIRSKK